MTYTQEKMIERLEENRSAFLNKYQSQWKAYDIYFNSMFVASIDRKIQAIRNNKPSVISSP